jgi:hypothetical protein
MPEAVSTTRFFPRGIANPGTSRAYVHDMSGTLLALDLATGKILWRLSGGLRPLAVVADKLVAARVTAPRTVEMVIVDTDDGRLRRVTKPLPLPNWVRPSMENSPEFSLRAKPEDRSLIIDWAAEGHYQGGAPPSARVRQAYEHAAHGAARVDLETGELEILDENKQTQDASPPQSPPSPDPDVLEQQEIGDKRFQLVAERGEDSSVRTLLRAIDLKSGETAWETLIEKSPLRRPKSLRP